jgi:hypothetical protein
MSCLTSTVRDMFLQGTGLVCRRWWARATLGAMYLIAILAGLALHEWPDGGQPLFDAGCALAPRAKISEPLMLTQEGLYRLDIALTRRGTVTGQVVLRLTSDRQGRNTIASAAVPATRAEDISRTIRRPYGFVSFRFAPAEDLSDGSVWLWLDAEPDGPLAARCLQDSQEGNQVALKTYYRRSAGRNLTLFLASLTDKSVSILNSPWSYGVLLVLYAALLVTLCRCVRRVSGRSGQDEHGAIE